MNNLRWEDLVFINRNQAYGAYMLRRAYPSRVTMSFVFAMTVVTMILLSPMIQKLFAKELNTTSDEKSKPVIVINQPPPIELIPLPPPPQVHSIAQQLRYVPPRVTEEEVVDDIPTIQELQVANISDLSTEGEPVWIDEPVTTEAITPEGDDPNKVWLNVEQQPEFPGGVSEMMKFIAKNTKYPASARRMGIEGIVYISFVVNADGVIDKVETIKGIQADCDKEAMRVVSKMPAWKPGKQNGKAVKVRFVVPIKYTLNGV